MSSIENGLEIISYSLVHAAWGLKSCPAGVFHKIVFCVCIFQVDGVFCYSHVFSIFFSFIFVVIIIIKIFFFCQIH